jgi:hypothetical protein
METIGLQVWNNPPVQHRDARRTERVGAHIYEQPPQSPLRRPQQQPEKRRSRGGRGRRRPEQSGEQAWQQTPPPPEHQTTSINDGTIMPYVRATRDTVDTLTRLERLYMLQHQLQQAREQQHQQHIAELERDIAATCARLRGEPNGEQQELVNRHSLRPVTRARLQALTAQIATLTRQLQCA